MEGDSSIEVLVPNQALAPWAATPMTPGFWAVSPSDQVARRGLATSLRAHGKLLAVQVELQPPVKTDKELAHQL